MNRVAKLSSVSSTNRLREQNVHNLQELVQYLSIAGHLTLCLFCRSYEWTNIYTTCGATSTVLKMHKFTMDYFKHKCWKRE